MTIDIATFAFTDDNCANSKLVLRLFKLSSHHRLLIDRLSTDVDKDRLSQ